MPQTRHALARHHRTAPANRRDVLDDMATSSRKPQEAGLRAAAVTFGPRAQAGEEDLSFPPRLKAISPTRLLQSRDNAFVP